jgi:hypothetical protein
MEVKERYQVNISIGLLLWKTTLMMMMMMMMMIMWTSSGLRKVFERI